jgi:hypothetical protein
MRTALIELPSITRTISESDRRYISPNLCESGRHVELADVICLVISGLIAVTIGLLQGRMIRLEARNGALWGQMPVRGLQARYLVADSLGAA